jgi:hypothetical protein
VGKTGNWFNVPTALMAAHGSLPVAAEVEAEAEEVEAEVEVWAHHLHATRSRFAHRRIFCELVAPSSLGAAAAISRGGRVGLLYHWHPRLM